MSEFLWCLYRYNTYTDGLADDAIPLLETFPVARKTPKGVFIRTYAGEKYVLAGSGGKRFAYDTKEAALASFIARKRRMLEILTHTHDTTKTALDVAKAMQAKGLTEAPQEKKPCALGFLA